MARQTTGWVKIHKKVCDSDIGRNFLLLGLWTTLIRWANWTESKINWRGVPRILARGEILTSLRELSEYGEVDRKTVAKWLNYLELRESISVTRSPKGSHGGLLIKINNYEKYQTVDATWSEEPGEESGHEPPRSLDTYKEYKNIRNNKADRIKFVHPTTLVEFKEIFSPEVVESWIERFNGDREWIESQFSLAYAYFYIKKIKAPSASVRGWVKRFDGWLNRGWEAHAKTKQQLKKPERDPMLDKLEF